MKNQEIRSIVFDNSYYKEATSRVTTCALNPVAVVESTSSWTGGISQVSSRSRGFSTSRLGCQGALVSILLCGTCFSWRSYQSPVSSKSRLA